MIRKTMADVRRAIRLIFDVSKLDAKKHDNKWVRDDGRSRLSTLNCLCAILGFKELEAEIQRHIDESYAEEQQILKETLK